jgi:hypothetical protein
MAPMARLLPCVRARFPNLIHRLKCYLFAVLRSLSRHRPSGSQPRFIEYGCLIPLSSWAEVTSIVCSSRFNVKETADRD